MFRLCVGVVFSYVLHSPFFSLFFFNDTATTEIYTLSLHDALPIWTPNPVGATTHNFSEASATSASSRAVLASALGSVEWTETNRKAHKRTRAWHRKWRRDLTA